MSKVSKTFIFSGILTSTHGITVFKITLTLISDKLPALSFAINLMLLSFK